MISLGPKLGARCVRLPSYSVFSPSALSPRLFAGGETVPPTPSLQAEVGREQVGRTQYGADCRKLLNVRFPPALGPAPRNTLAPRREADTSQMLI